MQDTNNNNELLSPFEQLREVDADGKEWWNKGASASGIRHQYILAFTTENGRIVWDNCSDHQLSS